MITNTLLTDKTQDTPPVSSSCVDLVLDKTIANQPITDIHGQGAQVQASGAEKGNFDAVVPGFLRGGKYLNNVPTITQERNHI